MGLSDAFSGSDTSKSIAWINSVTWFVQALIYLRFTTLEGLWITKAGFLHIQNLQPYYYPAYILLIGCSNTWLKNLKLITYYAASATATPVITVPDEGVGSDDTCVGDDTEGKKRWADWACSLLTCNNKRFQGVLIASYGWPVQSPVAFNLLIQAHLDHSLWSFQRL